MGDRICPSCEQESLVEQSLKKWKCFNPNCGETFEDDWLDSDVEEFE